MTKGQRYSNREENNEHEAVRILDLFTKAFCIDATSKDDLIFKTKFAPDYKDFGSMGDL